MDLSSLNKLRNRRCQLGQWKGGRLWELMPYKWQGHLQGNTPDKNTAVLGWKKAVQDGVDPRGIETELTRVL